MPCSNGDLALRLTLTSSHCPEPRVKSLPTSNMEENFYSLKSLKKKKNHETVFEFHTFQARTHTQENKCTLGLNT